MDPLRRAQTVARNLDGSLGERLHGVLLYGSVARGEFSETFSDINLLILVDRIDMSMVARLATLAREWPEQRIRPMLLEDREWLKAADAFAVELLEMKDAHERLAGRDPVADAIVERSAARLQLERELRSRIIHLHNGMVSYAGDPETLGELLMTALPSFATYLRTVIRLSGRVPPRNSREAIAQGTELVGVPAGGLIAAFDARTRGKAWKVSLSDPVLEQYAAAVEGTARYVDTLEERHS